MSKHTPGPWSTKCALDNSGDIAIVANVSNKEIIAECFSIIRGERTDEECEANARLMSAAPDMLAALVRLTEFCQQAGFPTDLADASIKKALGE